jgi:cell division protein FtsN
VFVYDQNGRLVPGARLFDQDGQPIRLGIPSCYSDVDGDATDAPRNQGYPYCPSSAPFQTAPNAAAPTPSESVAPTPTPTTTVTPSPAPSVRPSPSAGPSR